MGVEIKTNGQGRVVLAVYGHMRLIFNVHGAPLDSLRSVWSMTHDVRGWEDVIQPRGNYLVENIYAQHTQ